MFCRIGERYYQNVASLFFEVSWNWVRAKRQWSAGEHNRWTRSTTSEKKVLQYTMSLVSLSKYMSCFTYIFPSYQQAGFSEGVLASTKQKSLQCSAKHPGSINHGCWITLGVPQVCLHMWALWFYYDSNMAKRCFVSSIVDSYHRHGSSK